MKINNRRASLYYGPNTRHTLNTLDFYAFKMELNKE